MAPGAHMVSAKMWMSVALGKLRSISSKNSTDRVTSPEALQALIMALSTLSSTGIDFSFMSSSTCTTPCSDVAGASCSGKWGKSVMVARS